MERSHRDRSENPNRLVKRVNIYCDGNISLVIDGMVARVELRCRVKAAYHVVGNLKHIERQV